MGNKAFMPGCSLPSYDPKLVKKTMAYLKSVYPDLGAVQKCCGKPTAALGQEELFKDRFGQLQADFDVIGAEEVIVACQSCSAGHDRSHENRPPPAATLFVDAAARNWLT